MLHLTLIHTGVQKVLFSTNLVCGVEHISTGRCILVHIHYCALEMKGKRSSDRTRPTLHPASSLLVYTAHPPVITVRNPATKLVEPLEED